MPSRPVNVPPHQFRTAELVVLGITPGPLEIRGTHPAKPLTCPYCGKRVEVIGAQRSSRRPSNPRTASLVGSLATHSMPETCQPCPTASISTRVTFPNPDDPSSTRRPRGLRARKARGGAPRTPAPVRRAHKEYDDIHELNGERNNNHWRHSYGLIAEGSSGNDFLGAEGGSASVRTTRGGRADGNR
ncbi:hypothetical protein [uncultured Corynebacterium sp.]|uniref:hypothetical protein n=1 Tax=uncultured Corynebacterium sp. TaxID=159447 RepID=UPI0025E49C5C|nr:hypothetical protein [uncultured Corynebacterium sp.]